jgi:hypothetical protein
LFFIEKRAKKLEALFYSFFRVHVHATRIA